MNKWIQWAGDDEGPDWGDLKHNEKEEEPQLKKVKEVGLKFSQFLICIFMKLSLKYISIKTI